MTSRRTIAKLQSQTRVPLGDEPQVDPVTSEDGFSPGWECQDTDEVEVAAQPLETPRESPEGDDAPEPQEARSRRSGTTTPWNPHNLAMNTERGQIHRPTLARKLLQILGEFPVEDDASDNKNTEPRFQDPLWLIAGLAKRGWNLHGAQGNLKHSAALTSAGLPPEESRLLSKWTPRALQEIEKEQSRYFEHGILGSKSDVAPDLDPIEHGLVTEEKSRLLFQTYVENTENRLRLVLT